MSRKVVEKIIDSRFENTIKRMISKNKGYKSFLKNVRYNSTRLTSKFRKLNTKYQKDINPNYLYLTFIQNKGFIVADFKLGTIFCVNYNLEKYVSNMEIVDLLQKEKCMFIFFGDKKGNMIVVRFLNGKF